MEKNKLRPGPLRDVVSRLQYMGYEVILEPGGAKAIYKGEGDPPDAKAAPLLALLNAHRGEIVDHPGRSPGAIPEDPQTLIDQAFEEINAAWIPGALRWARGKPEFSKMIALEEEMSVRALKGDLENLKKTLESYRALMLGMVEGFRSGGRQESLFPREGMGPHDPAGRAVEERIQGRRR